VPYLTPDSIPEDDDCRPLSIPADSVWLALFGGALTELTKPYNWQQFGALTVEQTVAKMEEIINNWYSVPCAACTTPGGYRVIRINNSGRLEQLNESGEWEPATDEYYIPPPEPREGGTTNDKKCLAAANAVNVLEQLYESLSDSFNNELDEAEAMTAFILALIALVGFEFAPISWAIVAFFTAVFGALYSALEFIGADLWDEDVSTQIRCFLVDCANNDGGVITFDWDCFNGKLESLTNDFSLTESQLRLYLQIGFMLYFIGGADGLNLAGRTTAITEADCEDCGLEHCLIVDLTLTDGSEYGIYLSPGGGSWSSGEGYVGAPFDAGWDVTVIWEFPETLNVTAAEYIFTKEGGSGSFDVNNLRTLYPLTNYATTQTHIESANPYGIHEGKALIFPTGELMDGFSGDVNSGSTGSSFQVYIEAMIVRYKGDIPEGWIDNCPD